MANTIMNPNRVIIVQGNWGAIGSITAGGTKTVTKQIPSKTGYTGYLMDLHLSDTDATGNNSKIVMGYSVSGSDVTMGFTNNHSSSLNPTPLYTVVYIAN